MLRNKYIIKRNYTKFALIFLSKYISSNSLENFSKYIKNIICIVFSLNFRVALITVRNYWYLILDVSLSTALFRYYTSIRSIFHLNACNCFICPFLSYGILFRRSSLSPMKPIIRYRSSIFPWLLLFRGFFPLKRETDNNIVENEIEFDWSNVAKMTHPSSSTVAFNKSCPLLKTGYFLFHHPVYIAIKGSKRNKFFDIFLLLYLFYSILFYSPLFYFFSFFNLVSAYLEFLLFLFNITIFSIFLQLSFHFSFILSTVSFIFVCHKFFHLLWH